MTPIDPDLDHNPRIPASWSRETVVAELQFTRTRLAETLTENRRLKARLKQASAKLEEVVVTEGDDAGVVLLSSDAPARYEAGSDVPIYGLAYFSPLGEALMELCGMLRENSELSQPSRE